MLSISNLTGAEITILHIIDDNSELEGTSVNISSDPEQSSSSLSNSSSPIPHNSINRSTIPLILSHFQCFFEYLLSVSESESESVYLNERVSESERE